MTLEPSRRGTAARRALRRSRWPAWLALAGLACESLVAPALPDGATVLTPPPVYARWWAMTEACSRRTGDLSAVTWYVATGPEADTYNPSAMTPVKPGTFIYEPPNGHHYDMAKDEEVIVEIIGMGPVTTTSLEPGRGRGQQDH